MAIWNLGSINADMVYALPHLPVAGETLAASGLDQFLGGKGANMSVAAARAGSHVCHIGAVGADGRWAVDRLLEYGVDTRHIAQIDTPTGHAIIAVDQDGENQIILFPGANRAISPDQIGQALSAASAGDILVMQNETNLQVDAARMGRDLGLRVAYAAAPFDAVAVAAVLPHLDLLFLNAVEARQLQDATGNPPEALGVEDVIVTLGAEGARHFHGTTGAVQDIPALPVTPVDTTGAGDTFTGYVLSGLDRGMPMAQAMAQASRAAALMVTRHGTADVIPDLKEVQDSRL
ncbi:ribokinase [Phaeobacter gallaeciensis]|uniref:Ribokinase n=1 Tax=Phaeobacter gallaeciensis TaxID=60890 RepID=A0A1B0ZSH4_9RHOB|nr:MULTISPECIES: ribokinase [Phaeobacter]MEE2633326.1 ribokinase [Pseudomonadota bacterium]ANP37121.1 ribokinase [Phaeobacter gallaeciensis]MDE4061113.1 ribokinase [Phaeobacter gallaeciensis]MDE4124094.1 ribokinase [Phaeobacter gallaeciensis]MDE4128564.1 ribokinase [Phaeobacter gallaeciensis]